ncbi:MAG: hypothetical protein Q4D23_05605 [Bacteroidales bacterium]|nr:hypothetical protein [Bacteroidales bacterium]MDO4995517.1 hypothetical protein [Bacteroidales bacterium]
MPKSKGYILDTPLQTWSTAGGDATHSLLTEEIEHATMKHSRFVIVQNTRGLQKTSALQPALDTLDRAGYAPIVLEAGNKTLIIGKKK